VPEENFWTLWCKGRLTEADTLTIRLGATPSGLSSAHLHHYIKLVTLKHTIKMCDKKLCLLVMAINYYGDSLQNVPDGSKKSIT